jgi:hybrid cluster-associated redox disulfide protein
MELFQITPQMTVASLLTNWPQTTRVFLKHRMICVGCDMASFDTLSDVAANYAIPLAQFIDELSLIIQHD